MGIIVFVLGVIVLWIVFIEILKLVLEFIIIGLVLVWSIVNVVVL